MRTFMRVPPPFPRLPGTRKPALAAALAALPLIFACGSDSFKPVPLTGQDQLYWDLQLSHHAVLLATTAPYDTLTVMATPRNFRGDTLAGLPQPQYASEDVEKVTVTPDGVLHAVGSTAPGTAVRITASLTFGNVQYTDAVYVSVVDGTPPTVGSLSVHPVPPDSAKVAVSNIATGVYVDDTLPVRAVDATGTPIPTIPGSPDGILPVDIRAADTALINQRNRPLNERNVIQAYRVGSTKIYASTTVGGVRWADTLDYRVGWPQFMLAAILPSGTTPGTPGMPGSNIFSMPDVTIGVGGVVVWTNNVDTTSEIDIDFADDDAPHVASFVTPPSATPSWIFNLCGATFISVDCTNSGDALLAPGGYRWAIRVFPVPGTYEYTSTKHPGSGGRIVVVDER